MRGRLILIVVVGLTILGFASNITTAEELTEARKNIILKELTDLGFKKVGSWSLVDGRLLYDFPKYIDSKNILYAFIADETVKYIGKSANTIEHRMNGYINPGPTQKTNIRIRNFIIKELEGGKPVDIWIFIPKETFKYKGWDINVSAGLEDGIINRLSPEWNVSGK